MPKDVRREIQSIESTKFLNQKYKDHSYPVAQMGRDWDSKHTRSWWSCKAATVSAGVLRPLVSPQDVHARDALSDTGCFTKRKGTEGGILDQDVIHYDTWLRKHSQYAFTRLSAKMFEIKSTRKLEQVISTGVHSKQHKEKRGK